MKYSIVIPTYNHCDDLLKPCINSILQYSNLQDIELIISANGCFDNTRQYLDELTTKFATIGLSDNLKIVWNNSPTGYSKATNDGIKISTTNRIVLLNNDVLILEQKTNTWLELLNRQFELDLNCGISGPSKVFSEPAGRNFLIFFCVMIDRKVFDTIGLLNEEYGKGGGEDTEFCILAENAGFNLNICAEQYWNDELKLFVGNFPIYHKGEGTVHDTSLVPDWSDVFETNSLLLGKKFNPEWYRWKLSNNLERAVYLQNHPIDIREELRYSWAAKHLIGKSVLDIGCSSGYGAQYLTNEIEYTGLDYDAKIIEEAKKQNWHPNAKFIHANLDDYKFDHYNTIIAFEVIEHIKNGLELVEQLKNHCEQIIITVPYNESINVFNPHHLLRNLTPNKFKDFNVIGLIDLRGSIINEEERIDGEEYSLLMEWKKEKHATEILSWLNNDFSEMYNEVIKNNEYMLSKENMQNRNVLDIGANIGAFSLLANFYGAKKIIAMEPVSNTFNQLLTNIKKVNYSNIIPIKSAITSKSGEIFQINLNEKSGHNSLYKSYGSGDFEMISTISFGDILKFFDDDDIFLKIDCEGAEYDIILNATNDEMKRITTIAIEIHYDMHPIYKSSDIIEDKLSSFGFKLTKNDSVFEWHFSPDGKPFIYKELPLKVQFWAKI